MLTVDIFGTYCISYNFTSSDPQICRGLCKTWDSQGGWDIDIGLLGNTAGSVDTRISEEHDGCTFRTEGCKIFLRNFGTFLVVHKT